MLSSLGPAQTGGSATHTHEVTGSCGGQLDAGNSIIAAGGGSNDPSLTGEVTGSTSEQEDIAVPFYALAYIMKL